MAVHYTGGGGGLGLFGSILGGLSSLVPGLQPFAPYIAGASALAGGDPVGAATSVAGGIKQQNHNNSMFKMMWDASGAPNYETDPMLGSVNPWHRSWKLGGM